MGSLDQDDRELLIESRTVKMNFEMAKHNEMKTIELARLQLEMDRFQMERDTMVMQEEQISVQTNLKKSRIVLLHLEMFKQRQDIKKEYPDVTEEYLNENLPYPS